MPKPRSGTIAFVEGAQARPFLVSVKDTMTDIILRLTGVLTVTVGLTLNEDDIMRLLRRIQFTLDGNPFKIIGDSSGNGAAGKLMYYANQLLYGVLPEYTPPGVGVAAHPFDLTIKIPLSLPKRLSGAMGQGRHITSLQTGARELEIVVDWGNLADIYSVGTATLANVQIEVIPVTDPRLNDMPNRMFLQEQTQNLQVTAGANTNEVVQLNKSGLVPYIIMLGLDTDVRNDAVWNRLYFRRNTTEVEIDMSWEAMKAEAKAAASLQGATLPAGINLALFDEAEDGQGMLDVGDQEFTKGWDLTVDHDALGAAFRLFAHHYALISQR